MLNGLAFSGLARVSGCARLGKGRPGFPGAAAFLEDVTAATPAVTHLIFIDSGNGRGLRDDRYSPDYFQFFRACSQLLREFSSYLYVIFLILSFGPATEWLLLCFLDVS